MPDQLLSARQRPHAFRAPPKSCCGSPGVLIAIPAIALVILLNYDWNKARPWLNAKTSDAIGRPFAIRGDLSLKWEKPATAMTGTAATWRDHIPWPHLIANDVHVSNPAGMPERDMASVNQLSFSLNPFALLHHTIVIPVLRFEAPAVDLLRHADGANNWTFHHEDKPSPWTLDLERVVFTKGVVHFADAIEKADITADVDTIDADPTVRHQLETARHLPRRAGRPAAARPARCCRSSSRARPSRCWPNSTWAPPTSAPKAR